MFRKCTDLLYAYIQGFFSLVPGRLMTIKFNIFKIVQCVSFICMPFRPGAEIHPLDPRCFGYAVAMTSWIYQCYLHI